ncbi:hypothetical protein ARTHRO9AX_130014 [Arthrobacter sp. 9AX]|nr:hypothetical protein ARTHRO9AX_130014 [Arthrobacter sp. 9AX]
MPHKKRYAAVNTLGGFVNTQRGNRPLTCGNIVPEVGLEPTHLSIPHFECGASANSATRARNTWSKSVRPQLIVSNAIASRTRNYSTCR